MQTINTSCVQDIQCDNRARLVCYNNTCNCDDINYW